jgi:hypothetical protein
LKESQPTIRAQPAAPSRKTPFYQTLWVQVLVAIGGAIVLGYLSPARGIAMKPLGDAFIKLITMIITRTALLRDRFHNGAFDRPGSG